MNGSNLSKIYSKFKSHIILLAIRFVGIVALFISFKLINIVYGEILLGFFSTIMVSIQLSSLLVSFGLPLHTMKQLSIKKKEDRVNIVSNEIYVNSFSKIAYNSVIFIFFLSIFFLIIKLILFPNAINFITYISILVCVPLTSFININAQVVRANGGHVYFQWLNSNLLYLFFSFFLVVCYFFNIPEKYILLGFVLSTFLTFLFSVKFLPIKMYIKKFEGFKNHLLTLRSGFDFFCTQFITQGFNWVSILFTALFVGELETGGLNVINKYLSLTSLLIMVVNMSKGPDYTYFFHQNNIKALNKEISINTKFMFFLTLPIIVVLFIFPDFFLGIFSEKYHDLSLVFRVMLVGYLVNLYCGSVGMLMQMTNEQKKYRNIMLLALIIHLILGFVLTKNIGVLGLGISFAISLVFWNLFSVHTLKKKYNLISFLTFKKLT